MQAHRYYRLASWVLAGLFLLQAAFWYQTRHVLPRLGVVAPVPSRAAVEALSLGDQEAYFRVLVFGLQNMGDTFGRSTPLKDYDYPTLQRWFFLLDTLNATSHFVPSIASYYFSQSQHKPDVRYIIEYLETHAKGDLRQRWWWMGQAVFLANHKLKDKDLALRLAYLLASSPADDLPMWARQMPAFIHEQRGEKEHAAEIVRHILDHHADIPQHELNFMFHFLKERLELVLDAATLQQLKQQGVLK